jgi:hypothetical protein
MFQEKPTENVAGVFWSMVCLVGFMGAAVIEEGAWALFFLVGTGLFGLYYAYRAVRYGVLMDSDTLYYDVYRGWFARVVGLFLGVIYFGVVVIGLWLGYMYLK